ncbi:transglutaminase-like cysteine peptidase [Bradyrhizobium sp. AUGA SZCCT0222]|uniref:transglutaminase-like cysteine peptidase n=1 Tax=Bradyrhizobium sp. AUGA SZCCT0222 TaxID=2807668 RepID=UPI001BAD1628|nr:transglutaminase-like cysteine peptidase [Bradyrhizobium sp. AUGA SZCCT0222]MBR1271351.1 transglutaminase-like cysteine peptidase [Bradyrhizobium sp. AUGA SZCCT0222]
MAISNYPRALRAAFLACGLSISGLAWFGPAAAGTLLSPGAAVLVKKSSQPFGQPTAMLLDGGLHEKWQSVQRRLDDEMVQLALCEGDREGCVSPAALQFLAIIDAAKLREGRARLGEINRAVNLAVRPMSDLAQYGQLDVWASPLATLTRGGDCEDYAIAKFVALRRAGIAPDDLRIVIMRDTVRGEDHAVAAARLDGHWLTLDNRRMAMVEDSDIRNYRPTFVIDQHSVMRYTDAPLLTAASGNPEAPVVISALAAPGVVTPANQAPTKAD